MFYGLNICAGSPLLEPNIKATNITMNTIMNITGFSFFSSSLSLDVIKPEIRNTNISNKGIAIIRASMTVMVSMDYLLYML